MEKSLIKEILIKKREEKEDRHFKSVSYRRAYRTLYRHSKKENFKNSPNEKWLYENFYLIEEAMSSLKGKRISQRMRYFATILVEAMKNSDITDTVSAFFETMSEAIDDEEIDTVREALFAELMVLTRDLFVSCQDISIAINLIRQLSTFDFTPFFLGYFSYEQYLRRDPSGIYPKLDKESKALYKKKIKEYAKKRRMSFTSASEELILRAREKGCHIGEFLFTNKGKRMWLTVYYLIFAFFVTLSLSATFSIFPLPFALFFFLLTVIPLKEAAFILFVYTVSTFEKGEILPRLDMSRVDKDHATLTVITSLLTSSDEVKSTFNHLENISLKTRSRGKDDPYLFYGVLFDLPESSERKSSLDEKIIKVAKKEVDRLNGIYGERFLLFTRERVKDKVSGKFIAHERKRGAINELVKALSSMESSLEFYGATLPEIKYVLTLDSDTDVELGALNKMIGTMAHPLNAPVVSEKKVIKGFGVLAPTIATSLESAHATTFSSIMSGVGGTNSYHGTVFNLEQILYGKGLFCGKGMFDVNAYKETILDAFPDYYVLSHDLLEGTRLSAGNLSDITFFDSVPSTVYSYYNRAHRWGRGDVQNLRFILPYVPTLNGKIRNPMTLHERLMFLNNALNLLLPVFQVLGLFFVMWYRVERVTLLSFLLLLPNIIPLVTELTRSFFKGRLKTVIRQFFGDSLGTLCRQLIMMGWQLSALAFVAYKNSDAVIRSLWRMLVSRKNLLEWTTAGLDSKKKKTFLSMFFYTFFSFCAGVFMLVFARLSLCRLMGILWCLFPFFAYISSREKKTFTCHVRYREAFKKYARDIWRYFEKYTDETSNYLPPDNVSVFPSGEVANRTSPTNIGLYLLSVLAALDFSFISLSSCIDRLDKTITSIEKLPKYKGQLYNWYNTLTLEVIGNEYISTVDSGNFIACLVALYQGLLEYEGENRKISELCARIKKIEEESDFRFLYNSKRDLFSLGYFVDKNEQDGIVYDMYMSEARTTDYYAIARGIVKESHWSNLARPLTATKYGVGSLSWSGTAFEYFMPHLLLPVYKNSFVHEALAFAFSAQVSYGATVENHRVFGISESGYFAFDESLNYQYRAFGVPALSRSRDSVDERVISPYSTFLMLRENISLCVKNLKALEKLGMYGECGFYEALDLSEKRVGKKPSIVKSFMCHHLGMSLIALANISFGDVFVDRFMRDREMKAVCEILKEAVPLDAVSFRKEPKSLRVTRSPSRYSSEETGFRTAPAVSSLSGRGHVMTLFERGVLKDEIKLSSGEFMSALKPVSAFNPSSLFVFATDGDTLVSPSVSSDVSFAFDPVFARYKTNTLKTTISLSARTTATRIRLEMTGKKGEVGIYLEPILTSINSYMAHPAYAELFIRAEYDSENDAVIISNSQNAYLALMCSTEFNFEVSRLKLFKGEEYSLSTLSEAVKKPLKRTLSTSTPISPCLLAKCSYTSKADVTFFIGYGDSKSSAMWAARDEKQVTLYKSLEKSRELYSGALGAGGINEKIDRELYENLLSVFRPEYRWELSKPVWSMFGKEGVYSLGLSGDLPVFSVKSGTKRETVLKILKYKKLQYIMGARYDLVFEVADIGYFRGGRLDIESAIDDIGCRFLLGKKGGIFLADISKNDVSRIIDALAVASYPQKEKRVSFYKYESLVKRSTKFEGEERLDPLGHTVKKPEILHSHIIASSTFGTILSHRSLGNTWVGNSHLSRITFWENDQIGGAVSERIILGDKNLETDLCLSSSKVHFSSGRAEYISDQYNVKVAIHPRLLFKAVSVRVEKDAYSLSYKMIPVMDDFPRPSTVIEYESFGKNACMFRNLFSESLKGKGYIFTPFEKEMSIVDMGVKVECTKPGETVFILGYSNSEKHFEEVKRYFSTHTFSDIWRESHDFLFEKVEKAAFKNSLGIKMSEFFLPYQILVSRFYARSGPYQSGGAWGYRDQAQDCLSVIDMDRIAVRNHIFRLAAHQFYEGDVEHWWHYSKGIRTRCSDDYLWLVWLSCMYIERTKDKSILGVKIRYLDDKPLSPKEKDRYKKHSKTLNAESLALHLKRALDRLVNKGLGEHSLPFIEDGDWNDGLNCLPEGSESVWLGFFVRIVIGKYLEVIEENEAYRSYSQRVREGIEENAFFSDRYARAFLPDGRVLGIEESDKMKIDALPQAFSSIAHSVLSDGSPRRIALALDSAWRELYDERLGLFKLFTPPFDKFDKDIGYLTSYPEGIRENGGQYTHGAVWAAMGFLLSPLKEEENRERAITLAKSLDPSTKGSEYKGESYVMAGDVYSNPDNMGRCGWSWYTGSASWYRKLLLLIDEKRNNWSPFS